MNENIKALLIIGLIANVIAYMAAWILPEIGGLISIICGLLLITKNHVYTGAYLLVHGLIAGYVGYWIGINLNGFVNNLYQFGWLDEATSSIIKQSIVFEIIKILILLVITSTINYIIYKRFKLFYKHN